MKNCSSVLKLFTSKDKQTNEQNNKHVTRIVFRYRGRMKGSDINSLGLLPDKLKTELAIHVNLETLKRVSVVLFSAIFSHYL